jgi:glutaminyl-tRNA synthetase
MTRFPPEPNGYLHLGHAKAINFNFLAASANDGYCLLRFDDTNPAAEKKEYIDMIMEDLRWLGHTPWRVTYSSDYFQELYDFAEQLIHQGDAYVCAQPKADVKVCCVHEVSGLGFCV